VVRYRRAIKVSIVFFTSTAFMLVVAACGGGDSQSEPTALHTAPNGDVFNDADVEFLTAMIPHHAQAIQMVVVSQGRPLDPEVEQVANEIRDAQVPEVETMSDWLTAWGEEVPETSLDHSNAGHDMDDMDDMDSGMDSGDDSQGGMSSEEMEALENAPDAEFQDMWLEMMIEHHMGAIEMAEAEQSNGKFPDVISLAESIESAQSAEIKTLEELLG